VLGYDGMDMA